MSLNQVSLQQLQKRAEPLMIVSEPTPFGISQYKLVPMPMPTPTPGPVMIVDVAEPTPSGTSQLKLVTTPMPMPTPGHVKIVIEPTPSGTSQLNLVTTPMPMPTPGHVKIVTEPTPSGTSQLKLVTTPMPTPGHVKIVSKPTPSGTSQLKLVTTPMPTPTPTNRPTTTPTTEGNCSHDGSGLFGALAFKGCIVTDFAAFLTKLGHGSSRIYEKECLIEQVAITETSLEMVENKYKQSVNLMNRILFDLHGQYWHRMTKSWQSDFYVTNCISNRNFLKTYGADMRQLDYHYFNTKLELRTRLSDLLQQLERRKKENKMRDSSKTENVPLHPSLQNSICVCAKIDKKDKQAGLESTKSLDVNPQESIEHQLPMRKVEQKEKEAGLEPTKSLDVNLHKSTEQHQPIRECEQCIKGKKSTKSSQESAEQYLPISEDDKQKKEEADPESIRSSTVPLQQSADNQQPIHEKMYNKHKSELLGIGGISSDEYRKMDSSKYQALKNSSAVLEFIECMDNLSPCDTDDVDALVVHLDSQMEMIENMYKRSSAYVNREDYPEPGHSVKLEKSYHEAKRKTRQALRKIRSA